VGGLIDFLDKPYVSVYINEHEAEVIRKGIDMHPEILKKQIVKFFKNNQNKQPKFVSVPGVKIIQDKQVFQFKDVKNGYLVAIHTPAHTKGSMCFYTPSFGGCLFTGDTYYHPEKQFQTYGFERNYKVQTQYDQIIQLHEDYHEHLTHVFVGHNGDQKDEFIAFVKRKQKRSKSSTLECRVCNISNTQLYYDEKQPNLIFCNTECQKKYYFLSF
jgi:glyoxylase-like metal-dependent hydrolase (beta-lactamase superfamily II)